MKIKNQIELTHIAEEMIQNLHKQMNTLEVGQLIVCYVHTKREKQSCISSIDDLVCSELQTAVKIGISYSLRKNQMNATCNINKCYDSYPKRETKKNVS